jgi:hypothetical protein
VKSDNKDLETMNAQLATPKVKSKKPAAATGGKNTHSGEDSPAAKKRSRS